MSSCKNCSRLFKNVHHYNVALTLLVIPFFIIWIPFMGPGANNYSGISAKLCLDLQTNTNLTADHMIDLVQTQDRKPCKANLYPVLMDIKTNKITAPEIVLEATNYFFTQNKNSMQVSLTEPLNPPVANAKTVKDLFPSDATLKKVADVNNKDFATIEGISIWVFVTTIIILAMWVAVGWYEKIQETIENFTSLAALRVTTTILLWINVGLYWAYEAYPVYETNQIGKHNNLMYHVTTATNPITESGFVILFTFVLITLVASVHTLDNIVYVSEKSK